MELLLISDILLSSIALLCLVFACITDIKRNEVPNWLSFSLLALALAVRAIFSIITFQFSYFLYALIALALFFILSNILYYIKFFGGGDAKLLVALAVVFATTPLFVLYSSQTFFEEPFLLSFFINIFIIGSVYSWIFIAFFAIKNRAAFTLEFKKIYRQTKIMRFCFLVLAFAFLIASFFITIFIPLLIIALIFPYLYILAKATENSSMIKKVSPRNLTEGDWLIEKVQVKNKMIRPSIHGLNAKDITTLRKSNKRVLIRYGIPFVPVFLISLIISFLLGDLIIFILRAFFF